MLLCHQHEQLRQILAWLNGMNDKKKKQITTLPDSCSLKWLTCYIHFLKRGHLWIVSEFQSSAWWLDLPPTPSPSHKWWRCVPLWSSTPPCRSGRWWGRTGRCWCRCGLRGWSCSGERERRSETRNEKERRNETFSALLYRKCLSDEAKC